MFKWWWQQYLLQGGIRRIHKRHVGNGRVFTMHSFGIVFGGGFLKMVLGKFIYTQVFMHSFRACFEKKNPFIWETIF